MLKVSDTACAELRKMKEDSAGSAQLSMRVGLLSGSTTGPNLGISMDEKTDMDKVFGFDDVELIIDERLLNYCEEITIDYVKGKGTGCGAGGGFRIVARNPL